MPEYIEPLEATIRLKEFIIKQPPKELEVKDIWVDATAEEAAKAKNTHVSKQGHVYPLLPKTKIVRGMKNNKTPVYPRKFQERARGRPLLPLRSFRLTLVNAYSTPRTMDLEFKDALFGRPYWAQVSIEFSL